MTPAAPPSIRRRTRLGVLGLVLGALAFLTACTPEQNWLYDQANLHRRLAGLAAFNPHGEAMDKAQAWAEHLAATGTLEHSTLSDGIVSPWRRIGENVGRGPSMEAILQGFLASPAHRANWMDPGYTAIGVGQAVAADGTVYVVQVFLE